MVKYNDKLLSLENKFNVFKMCGVKHYENSHSTILAELLRTDGSHGQKHEFLEAFINVLKSKEIIEKFDFDFKNVRVYREHKTKMGRIDILIKNSARQAIIIENKIYASDIKDQLKRYSQYGKAEFKDNFILLYLSLYGQEASEDSAKDSNYHAISFEETIISWLERCIEIAACNTPVRESLVQYINHLKTLTGQSMDKSFTKELILLLADDKNLEAAITIGEHHDKLKNYLINERFLKDLNEVCQELELKLEEKTYEKWEIRKYRALIIDNPKWNSFVIRFEFIEKGLRDLVIGYKVKDPNNRNHNAFEELKKIMPKHNDRTGFAYRTFHVDKAYVNWGKKAMVDILNGELVKVFKNELQLMLDETKHIDM